MVVFRIISNAIVMTILFLLFLSGLLLQGLKVLLTHTVIQMEDYVEAYDKKSMELIHREAHPIRLSARTDANNRMNRVIYHNSTLPEESSSDLPVNEAFMQPVFTQTA
jgi:hypothetical protein